MTPGGQGPQILSCVFYWGERFTWTRLAPSTSSARSLQPFCRYVRACIHQFGASDPVVWVLGATTFSTLCVGCSFRRVETCTYNTWSPSAHKIFSLPNVWSLLWKDLPLYPFLNIILLYFFSYIWNGNITLPGIILGVVGLLWILQKRIFSFVHRVPPKLHIMSHALLSRNIFSFILVCYASHLKKHFNILTLCYC
jgi:hypothetical protein